MAGPAQEPGPGLRAGAQEPRHAGHPPQPPGHGEGAERPRLPEGRDGPCTCCGGRSGPTPSGRASASTIVATRTAMRPPRSCGRRWRPASGQDLGWFFDQWLRRSGVPRPRSLVALRPEAEAGRGDGPADPAGRHLPAPARAGPRRRGRPPRSRPARTPRLERVELRDPAGTFRFPGDEEPTDVVLDPETWLLAETAPLRARGADPALPRAGGRTPATAPPWVVFLWSMGVMSRF